MVSEIELYLDQLLSIVQAAPGVVNGLDEGAFNRRPGSGRWSIAEHFDHLNMLTTAYLPVLDRAIASAHANGRLSQGPFSYGWIERFALAYMEPPPRRKTPAPSVLIPRPDQPLAIVMGAFAEAQKALEARLRAADGVDLARVRLRSPIGPIYFTLGASFAVILAHQRRHIYLAREVRQALFRV